MLHGWLWSTGLKMPIQILFSLPRCFHIKMRSKWARRMLNPWLKGQLMRTRCSSGGESQAYVLSQGSVQSWFYSCPPLWEPFCWMVNMWISGPRGVELSWPPWIIWDLGLLRSATRTHLSGTGQGLKTPSDDNCCFPGFALSKPCASPALRSADWVTDLCGLLSASVPLVF